MACKPLLYTLREQTWPSITEQVNYNKISFGQKVWLYFKFDLLTIQSFTRERLLPLLQPGYCHVSSQCQHTSSNSRSSRDNVGKTHQMLSLQLEVHSAKKNVSYVIRMSQFSF